MKQFILFVFLLCPVAVYSAEKAEPPPTQTAEPKLYDHYLSVMRMQERLAGRSLEEQARLQPQLQRAEQLACDRVRRDRQNGVPKEEYRQHGDDQFLVFAQYFEQYCETFR
jgi:hypothetical protein